MLDIKQVYNLDESIIIKGINNKYWALNTKYGTQYKLNRVSYDILSNLNGVKTVEQILDDMLNKYNIDSKTLETDINNFIERAIEKKIIYCIN